MDLSTRSYQPELLDRDDIPFTDIKRNMYELNFINTYLGGHAITIEGLKRLVRRLPGLYSREILICEIGCGGGDNLHALDRWCKDKNIRAHFLGVDINGDCIRIANEACNGMKATFIHSDYRIVRFDTIPDIIFSSLFCHHFAEAELVDMLQWMKQNSTAGFFINDLHRNYFAYYSISWLTKIFSRSYLVKHDAPLSVARGFLKQEWITLFRAANINNFRISWQWAFRWLIVSVSFSDSPSLHNENQQHLH